MPTETVVPLPSEGTKRAETNLRPDAAEYRPPAIKAQKRIPRIKTSLGNGPQREIYRTLDSIPFTPSQGICTPSPTNIAANWGWVSSPFHHPASPYAYHHQAQGWVPIPSPMSPMAIMSPQHHSPTMMHHPPIQFHHPGPAAGPHYHHQMLPLGPAPSMSTYSEASTIIPRLDTSGSMSLSQPGSPYANAPPRPHQHHHQHPPPPGPMMMYSPFYGGSYSAISPTHVQAAAGQGAGRGSRARSRGPSPLGQNNMGSGMSPFGSGAASSSLSPSPMPGNHQQQQLNSPGMYGTSGGGSGPATFHQYFGGQKGGQHQNQQQQKQRYDAPPPPPPPQRNTKNGHNNFTIPAGGRNIVSLSVAIPHASANSISSPLPSSMMMGNGSGGPRSLASESTVKKGAIFASTVYNNNNTISDRDDTRSPSRDYYDGREDCTDDDVQLAAIMMGAHSVARSILSLALEGSSSSNSSSSDNEDEEQTTEHQQQPPSQLVELASLLISYGLMVPAAESPTTILPVIAGGNGSRVFTTNTSSVSYSTLKSKLSMSSTLIESSGDSITSSDMIAPPSSTGKKQKSHPRVNADGSIRLNARQRRTLRRAQDRAVKALVTVMMGDNDDNNNSKMKKMSEEEASEAVKLLCSQQATVFGSPPAVIAGPARIGGRGSAPPLSPLPIKSFGGIASPQVKGPSSTSPFPIRHKPSFALSSQS